MLIDMGHTIHTILLSISPPHHFIFTWKYPSRNHTIFKRKKNKKNKKEKLKIKHMIGPKPCLHVKSCWLLNISPHNMKAGLCSKHLNGVEEYQLILLHLIKDPYHTTFKKTGCITCFLLFFVFVSFLLLPRTKNTTKNGEFGFIYLVFTFFFSLMPLQSIL